MGQVVKMNRQRRITLSRLPKEKGETIEAKDVKAGMSIYMDIFQEKDPRFYEVIQVESLAGGDIIRIHTPKVLSDINSKRNLSDLPPDFPVTVLPA